MTHTNKTPCGIKNQRLTPQGDGRVGRGGGPHHGGARQVRAAAAEAQGEGAPRGGVPPGLPEGRGGPASRPGEAPGADGTGQERGGGQKWQFALIGRECARRSRP